MMYIVCVDGATLTPLTSSLVSGRLIVLTSVNSWSMSYTEVVPSCTTYSRCWTAPLPVTTGVGVLVAGSDDPAEFDATTATRSVRPTSASVRSEGGSSGAAVGLQV